MSHLPLPKPRELLPPPTDQQKAITACHLEIGESIQVDAGAGTGKTTNLLHFAKSRPESKILYICFNNKGAAEAARRFAACGLYNVTCSTIHGLARDVKSTYTIAGKFRTRIHLKAIKVELDCTHAHAWRTQSALNRFYHSGDPEPNESHCSPRRALRAGETPDPQEAEKAEADMLQAIRSGLLRSTRKIWEKTQDLDDPFPISFDGYLKIFQLSHPVLDFDYILLDESQDCQPTGTIVTTPTGEKTIESLKVGDLVVPYDQLGLKIVKTGRKVTHINSEDFQGDLIEVSTKTGLTSKYAPQHICIVRIGDGCENKKFLYLMRKGNQWRVGVTSPQHGKQRSSGFIGRLREENADDMWILKTFDSRAEAMLAEKRIMTLYGIPDARFVVNGQKSTSQPLLDKFWEEFSDLNKNAERCLKDHNRDIRYPFTENITGKERKNTRQLLLKRKTLLRACNLLDGMMVIDARDMLHTKRKDFRRYPKDWTPIQVKRTPYNGKIWKIAVEDKHTYVGDGIVTHNCNPVTIALLQDQVPHSRIVLVGDENQALYGFRQAVNAMEHWKSKRIYPLNESFRFGKNIAACANLILQGFLNPNKEIIGHKPADTVGRIPRSTPHILISRTNARLIEEALQQASANRKVHFVGTSPENNWDPTVPYKLNDVHDAWFLQQKRKGDIRNPYFHNFDSYDELLMLAKGISSGENADGIPVQGDKELEAICRMVEKYEGNLPKILQRIVDAAGSPEEATLLLSTTHRSKGLEFPLVRMADDFTDLIVCDKEINSETNEPMDGPPRLAVPGKDADPEEFNILYVAATRASMRLEPAPQILALLEHPHLLANPELAKFEVEEENTCPSQPAPTYNPTGAQTNGKPPAGHKQPPELKIPYEEKDIAKELAQGAGGRLIWNPTRKTWTWAHKGGEELPPTLKRYRK